MEENLQNKKENKNTLLNSLLAGAGVLGLAEVTNFTNFIDGNYIRDSRLDNNAIFISPFIDLHDSFGDRDHDGISNELEGAVGTNPDKPDSNLNGINDREELFQLMGLQNWQLAKILLTNAGIKDIPGTYSYDYIHSIEPQLGDKVLNTYNIRHAGIDGYWDNGMSWDIPRFNPVQR